MKIEPLLTAKNALAKGELRTILVSTFLISLILSFSQILVDPVINNDGALYIQASSYIQKKEWLLASQTYNWLFYPYIIAQFSTLTTVSLEYSAYILNSFFTAVTCIAFILIIKECGGKSKTTLWFACLIILCFPSLNEYRNMVVRDHGYWALYLISCYFFIKTYTTSKHLSLLLPLVISTALAALFRIEGLVFFLLLPIIVIFTHQSLLKNLKYTLILAIIITLTILITYNFFFQSITISGFTKIIKIEQFFDDPFSKIKSYIGHSETFINKLSPKGFSNDYAPFVLFLVFLSVLLTEIFSTIGPFYTIMLGIVFFKTKGFASHRLFQPWVLLILINVAILSTFLFSKFFLAGRYPIPLALTLLIPLPFLFQAVYQQFISDRLPHSLTKSIPIIAVLFVILSIDSLVSFGPSKTHIKKAGEWIATSHNIQEKTLFTNNHLVSFYAHHHDTKRTKELKVNVVISNIKQGKLKNYDLLAIDIGRKENNIKVPLISALNVEPIKVFENNRGDSILVFEQ